jgi:hydrophobe/amphiphile efflux-3 (HAE3) family protein
MKRTMFVVRYRWWIIIAATLCVLLSIIPLSKISINPDLESYLPNSMQSKQNNRMISEVFGNEEPILIVIESRDVLNASTLQRIKNLSGSFLRISEFKRVFSVFQTKNICSLNGSMVVNPVVENIPETATAREKLRSEIKVNDLAYKLVISDDFKYALIMLSSDKTKTDAELVQIIGQTLKKFPGSEKVYITGQPYLRYEANQKISRDVVVLLPIGLIVMLLFLWVSFREIRGALLPFSVVLFSIVVCMGLIPAFGWKLSLIGILIPIMMIAIANNYGVYLIAKYQEMNANRRSVSMYKIVQESVKYLKKPITYCGIATIVGVLGLVVHLMIPARQMGVIASIGIGFALLASLTYIPAVMSLLKKGKPHRDLTGETHGFFFMLINRIGRLVTEHPKRLVTFFVAFFILCSSGLFFFRVAADTNDVLPKKHPFNQAIDIANKHFGGNKIITVMFEGDAKDPKLLRNLDRYEKELKKMPNVGSVTSLATIIRKMSMALNDSTDPAFNNIPQSRDAVAQYIELYSMSGDPADFEQFVNFDYTKTLMTIQYQADKLIDINVVLAKIEQLTRADSLKPLIGGYSLVDKELSESVLTGQNYSLLFAFVAIWIILSLIFKSLTAGWLGSLPLVFAVFCTFGLMGWLGIELNLVTALLSSISIGLGVDFTIQILWRLKTELVLDGNYITAIITTLRGIGRGITINAFCVMMGFSVLFLSAFPLIQSFAFLIIISLFLCLICSIVLIPALCIILRPKFLYNPTIH